MFDLIRLHVGSPDGLPFRNLWSNITYSPRLCSCQFPHRIWNVRGGRAREGREACFIQLPREGSAHFVFLRLLLSISIPFSRNVSCSVQSHPPRLLGNHTRFTPAPPLWICSLSMDHRRFSGASGFRFCIRWVSGSSRMSASKYDIVYVCDGHGGQVLNGALLAKDSRPFLAAHRCATVLVLCVLVDFEPETVWMRPERCPCEDV